MKTNVITKITFVAVAFSALFLIGCGGTAVNTTNATNSTVNNAVNKGNVAVVVNSNAVANNAK